MVRDVSKHADLADRGVTPVEADATDAPGVAEVAEGHDVAVSALGVPPDDPRSYLVDATTLGSRWRTERRGAVVVRESCLSDNANHSRLAGVPREWLRLPKQQLSRTTPRPNRAADGVGAVA